MAMWKTEKKSVDACALRAFKKENLSRHAIDPRCKIDLTVSHLWIHKE
jgi:hypothetical protein